MRVYVFAPRAQHDLQSQINYLKRKGAYNAAEHMVAYIENFIGRFLIHNPRIGIFVGHRNLYEIWIPKTRLVVWYRFPDSELQIVRLWHVAQDRASAPTSPRPSRD